MARRAWGCGREFHHKPVNLLASETPVLVLLRNYVAEMRMLNIRRVDHKASSTHCWRVRVQRRKQVFLRDFSDGPYGGREQALQAAQVYRNTLIQAHPPLSKPAYCAILKKTNRSGISGLTRVDRWEMSKGKRARRLYWEVQWPIENCKAKHRKFSIPKYGEEGAYQMALAARETALQALASQTFAPFESRVSRDDQAA